MNGTELDRRLASLVIQRALLTADTLDHVLGYAAHQGTPLVDALLDLRMLNPSQVLPLLQEVSGYQAIDPSLVAEDPAFTAYVTHVLPPLVTRATRAIPVRLTGNGLQVAMVEPWDDQARLQLEAFSGGPVVPVVMLDRADGERLPAALDDVEREWQRRLDRPLAQVLADAAERVHREQDVRADLARCAEVVLAVHAVLCHSAAMGASDIHLDSAPALFRVRVRVDGRLRELVTASRALAEPFMRRLRVLGGVDTAAGTTVDGSFSAAVNPQRRVEARLSIAAAVGGDRGTLRLVDRGGTLPTLGGLGMDSGTLVHLRGAVAQPHGLIVVAGPTGSGKTSTLYALLSTTICDDRAVFTAEDPVEREVCGAVQVPCSAAHGLGFATVLRSLLRQDPDVLMVGEARDAETALLGVQAASTGHLVLTSVHANSAAATVTRLLGLGIEPYVLASVLRAVIAQRLVRRLCLRCRLDGEVSADDWRRCGGGEVTGHVHVFTAGGCEACGGTGYRGRIGIFELMTCSPALRTVISHASADAAIERSARSEGMQTLREAGLARVLAGDTSIEEVLSVSEWSEQQPHARELFAR